MFFNIKYEYNITLKLFKLNHLSQTVFAIFLLNLLTIYVKLNFPGNITIAFCFLALPLTYKI